MNAWLKKREEKLAELTMSTHILAYLLVIAIFIISDPIQEHSFTSYSAILIGILIPATVFIVLDYQFLQGKSEKNTFLAWNITKHAVLFAMITTVFSTSQIDHLWLLSAMYLLPITLSCITLGKVGGMAFAAAAAASIFLLSGNISLLPEGKDIETFLILGGIFFVLAWFLGGIIDIKKQTTERLTSLINEDSLTGIGNHRYLHEQLNQESEKASKEKFPLSLILLDIDFFKKYNETYGHPQGDLLLQEIAKLIKMHSPPEAILARYSSDVFAVILPQTDLQQAFSTADNLNQAVSNHDFPGEINLPYEKITISAGIANYPYHVQTAGELLDAADEALYSSKSTGRNRVRIYHAIMERLIKTAGEDDRELTSSLRTLMTVVNGKDRYTYSHSERVSFYAKKVGKRLGLSSEKLRLLEFGAFLHDLGKLEIPREVLNKKGALSTEEWEMMRQHPVWGSEILRPISLLQPIIPMILHHHENFDGSGYPEGLRGKKIPLFARILRVVDSFDAITTGRPYRKLLTKEEAAHELLRFRNLHYDPLILDIFINIIKEEYAINLFQHLPDNAVD